MKSLLKPAGRVYAFNTLLFVLLMLLSFWVAHSGYFYVLVGFVTLMLMYGLSDDLSLGGIAHNEQLLTEHVQDMIDTRIGPHLRAVERLVLRPRESRGVNRIEIEDIRIVQVKKDSAWIKGIWTAQWPQSYFENGHIEQGIFWLKFSYMKHPWGWWFERRVKLQWSSDDFEKAAKLVEIPGGKFWMGSPDDDDMAQEGEKPRHERAVDSFFMSAVPATEKVYAMVMGQETTDSLLPRTYLEWITAIECVNMWSQLAGRQPVYKVSKNKVQWNVKADGFRLPTEAEWEYACRAGSKTRFWWGDDETEAHVYAWYKKNAENRAHPVGQKPCNTWGLHDMAGNVWEWCWTPYEKSYLKYQYMLNDESITSRSVDRVVRGGAFVDPVQYLRSASRNWWRPDSGLGGIGFRCVSVSSPALGPLSDSSMDD